MTIASNSKSSNYNVVMFAYNEERNIRNAITSVKDNSDERLQDFYLIANGCTDRTVHVAKQAKKDLGFPNLIIKEIVLGDKCNAWNIYVHEFSSQVGTHFFCDADVIFSDSCFSLMHAKLQSSPEATVAVAGLPLSGRNRSFYQSLVKERSCFFGNLYGLRDKTVADLQKHIFRLPVGLSWIDSMLTIAINTDLQFDGLNRENRVTWVDGCGYSFNSLSFFRVTDIKLYLNRIGRYELGKLQVRFLDNTPFDKWPDDLDEINSLIFRQFEEYTNGLSRFKKHLVRKRLLKSRNTNNL